MNRDSPEYFAEVLSCLLEVECILRNLQLWSDSSPAPEAFASTAPFSVDTMDFNEWLQFVFIPKLRALVDEQNSLPLVSGMAPMAEEFFHAKGVSVSDKVGASKSGVYSPYSLMVELKKIDALLSL